MTPPAFDLTGKVALVTGGNGGIGLGMAEGLAAAGADVAIWGGNPEKLAAAEARLKAHGRRVLVQRCDVADEAAVDRALAEVVATLGRLDACFANAGVTQRRAAFHELTTAEWRRVMSVNLDGAFFTLRAAARHMVERAGAGDPGGRLIAVASTAAVHGPARAEAYAASKGALLAMMRALAVELARHGVTANSILPGWIETEMTASRVADPKFSGAVLPRIPMRRWGTGGDFAGIAVYLASDASSYHTGDAFVLDGAYTIF
ncbi:MAG TPA: SDR family NAD(P)-dependent oxidoreductase [Candidatus Sulfotelmatobacter sp.]|nr:SDR family NAD(P)-dependent oxidoreductase [Candidatus Sulfotelmatobacter sp.]